MQIVGWKERAANQTFIPHDPTSPTQAELFYQISVVRDLQDIMTTATFKRHASHKNTDRRSNVHSKIVLAGTLLYSPVAKALKGQRKYDSRPESVEYYGNGNVFLTESVEGTTEMPGLCVM
jgi:hypothetical protein